MNFSGNQKKVSFLNLFLQKGNFNHAYLFSGPTGVGKFTLAKIFALSLISKKNKLDFSKTFDNTDLLDLLLVEPKIEEKKGVIKQKNISVESVRDALINLSLFPYRGAYKVLIINNAHLLTISAQNALLKNLEEPNETSILILISDDELSILPTIKSRCQRINFSLADESEMREKFEGKISSDIDLLSLAMGRPGLLEKMLKDKELIEFSKASLSELFELKNSNIIKKLKIAEDSAKNIVKSLEKLALWSWILRLSVKNKGTQQILGTYAVIEKIDEASTILKTTNANPRLVLENLFMEI